jgi:hypothetical protein
MGAGPAFRHAQESGALLFSRSLREGRGPLSRQAHLRPEGGTASPPKRDLMVVTSGTGRYKGGVLEGTHIPPCLGTWTSDSERITGYLEVICLNG